MTELQLGDTMPEDAESQRIRAMTNRELTDEYETLLEEMEEVVEEVRFRKMNETHPANRKGELPPVEEEGVFDEGMTEYYLALNLL